MKYSGGVSSQDVGSKQYEKLKKWIKNTPLNAIPLNYHGASAKSTICRLLGITTSTIGTNRGIRQAFQELDVALSRRANAAVKGKPSPSDVSNAERLDLPSLLDEIDGLKCEVARLRHVTHTGQWIEE